MQLFRRDAVVVGACALLFAIACATIANNNLPYLDDHNLILLQRELGFWGPTTSFQALWGYYRYFYTSMMGPMYWLLAEHLWIARTLGLAMHLGSSFLLFMITGNIGLSRTARIFAFVLFLFFPFSLEAIAWPANLMQYPLAPLLALGSAALISSTNQKNWKLALGCALLGGSFWIHEQIGPIVILLLMLCLPTMKNRALVASGVMLLIVGNLVLIYVTRDTNIRLSGSSAGSLSNIIANADYAKQLIRTTPFGDLYYYHGGVSFQAWQWFICALACAGLVAWVASKPDASMNYKRSFFFLIMGAGAYVVSIAPVLMSPVPWHTGRVIYIPFLALTIALAFLVELIALSHHIARVGMALLCGAVVVWGASALKDESLAFASQITTNAERAAALKPLVADDLKTDGTVIIAQGWAYNDFDRPVFGEHFIGMTQSELVWSLGLRLDAPPLYPHLIVSANRDRLCKLGDDLLSATVVSPKDGEALRNAKNIVVAFWHRDHWAIQRGHPVPELSYLREIVPECAAPLD